MNAFFVLLALGLACLAAAAPASQCDIQPCLIFCANGFKKDANGCEMCECNEPAVLAAACEPVACDLYCKNGYAKDTNGCETCACADPVCQPVACNLYCANGYKKAADGCEYCECNAAPVLAAKTCDPVFCDIYCEHGFVKDANNCDICECQAAPAKPLMLATTQTTCQAQRAKAISSGLFGAYTPECDTDGNFVALQRKENMYACVTPDGVLATDWMSAAQGQSFDCTCSIKAKQATATPRLGVYVPQCNADNGKFAKHQCSGSTGYCWCVDVNTGERDWTVIAKPGQELTCIPVA